MKRLTKVLPVLLVLSMLFTGCIGKKSIDPETIEYLQLQAPKEGQDIAVVDTTMGEITILLYTDEVPVLVQNFKDLVGKGFFDGQVIFHYEPSVKALAFGSSSPDGNGGDTNTGKPLKAEYSQNLWPYTGSVSMLCYEAGQFFNKAVYYDSRMFMLGKTDISDETVTEMEGYYFPSMLVNSFKEVGGAPSFSQYHSVFGKIIQGMDVVEAMTNVEMKDLAEGEETMSETGKRPAEDIVINKVTLSTFKAADYEKLDNTMEAEAFTELLNRSAIEQAEKEAAMQNGGSSTSTSSGASTSSK